MVNIGFFSHDHAVRALIKQIQDRYQNLKFYELDHELNSIKQYGITHIVFDFNNFESLEDSRLYQHMCELDELRFLIIGNEISVLLHNKLHSSKVLGHLLKPLSMESLYAAINYQLLDQKAAESFDKNESLLGSRLYSYLLGYYFLNNAVQYCRDNQVDDSVRMAVIYDTIATNYHTTKSNVEKSIRKLIAVYEQEQHWTNSEYILYFYGQLHLKQSELQQ